MDSPEPRCSGGSKDSELTVASFTCKNSSPSDDLPSVVGLVDTEEKIKGFRPTVDELFERAGSGGMDTIEHADITRYSLGTKR